MLAKIPIGPRRFESPRFEAAQLNLGCLPSVEVAIPPRFWRSRFLGAANLPQTVWRFCPQFQPALFYFFPLRLLFFKLV
jgi:hypothetical protein